MRLPRFSGRWLIALLLCVLAGSALALDPLLLRKKRGPLVVQPSVHAVAAKPVASRQKADPKLAFRTPPVPSPPARTPPP